MDRPSNRVLMVSTLVALLVLVLLAALAIGTALVTMTSGLNEDQAGPRQVRLASASVSDQPPAPVRVATFNTNRFRTPIAVHRDVVRLARRADVLVLQETPRSRVYMPGWGTYRWRAAGSGNRPILWRVSRFALVRAGSVLAQHRPISRRTTWVLLRDRLTGSPWMLVDYHGLPHVERRGHPRIGTHVGRCPCVPAYRLAMMRLGNLVRATSVARLVVAGDFNVGAAADRRVRWPWFPASWSQRVGLTDAAARFAGASPTLHGRRVDYVLTRRNLVPRSVRVLYGYGSDHRPVVATFPAA